MSSRTPSKRLAALFLLALVAVLVLIGAVIHGALGPLALSAYVAAVVLLGVAGAVVVRRQTPPPAPDHTGCSCCAGRNGFGVEVV